MKEIPFIWKGAQMKCLIDSCNGVAKIRGLCPICYQAAAATVKKGEVDWLWLELNGLANKPQHKSSGHGAFAIALEKQLAPLSGDMIDKDVALKALQQARDDDGCTIGEFIKKNDNG